MTIANTRGALAGLRIVDLSRVLAGPYSTMLLADFGAEVIKVERPDAGDDTRNWGPPWFRGQSTYFLGINRNKNSISLDLEVDDDLTRLKELVAEADVLVQNFRPGALARRGLDYETLKGDHPGLVYCSITGFGAGEGAALPGYDLVAQSVSGLMSLTGDPSAGPAKVGAPLIDVITGLHATVGITVALLERARTGTGQHVEVNLLSSALSALTNHSSAFALTGTVGRSLGNAHPSVAPYQVFETEDRPLTIAAANGAQFHRLTTVIGRPELAADPRFKTNADRVEHREELAGELESALKTRDADHWFSALTAAGVPCGPVNDIAQAFALADQLGLEPVVRCEDADDTAAVSQVANPISLSRSPARYRTEPPPLS